MAKTLAAPENVERYYIYDPRIEWLGPNRIQDTHRKEGIDLTESAARYYVEQGVIGKTQPGTDKEVDRMAALQRGEDVTEEESSTRKRRNG